MDRNFFTAMALSMGVFMLWMSYQASIAPMQQLEEATDSSSVVVGAESTARSSETAAASDPTAPTPDRPVPTRALPPTPPAPQMPIVEKTIRSDRYVAELTSVGGALKSWKLLEYSERKSGPTEEDPIELLSLTPERAALSGALLTPFTDLGFGSLNQARFAVESESENAITFAYRKAGVTVRKIYDFSDSSSDFGFSLTLQVENGTGSPVATNFELLWPAVARDGEDFKQLGPLVRSDGEVERAVVVSGGYFSGGGAELEDRQQYPGPIDWAGIETRYFVGVMAPAQYGASVVFDPVEPARASVARMVFPRADLAPGQTHSQVLRGYLGPKKQEELEAFGSDLETVISRGWSIIAPLTRFFEWMLVACYSVVGNYGLAIIVLTLLVRLLTLPILQNQMKSMEKMRALQPKLKELQEKHADDRQKQSEEMMRLYREEGVNPLGGCLPMLLQMPVFIGLFFALQSAIELRHAPFVGWMTDLSAPEALFVIPIIDIPFRVLPMLMAGSMVAQQKLTPTAMDPQQAAMMMTVMPLMMLFLFYSFPSGLVLYYMLSNVLGIAHQLWVGKNMREAQ